MAGDHVDGRASMTSRKAPLIFGSAKQLGQHGARLWCAEIVQMKTQPLAATDNRFRPFWFRCETQITPSMNSEGLRAPFRSAPG